MDTESQLQADQRSMARVEGLGSFLFIVGAGFAVVGMLWLAGGEFQLQHISGPEMAMMVFAMLAGFEALMPLPAAFQFLSHTRQAAVRLREVVEEKPIAFVPQEEIFPVKGHIRFDDMSFAYGLRRRVWTHDCEKFVSRYCRRASILPCWVKPAVVNLP